MLSGSIYADILLDTFLSPYMFNELRYPILHIVLYWENNPLLIGVVER